MTTRRDFLKSSALGAGALSMPAGLFARPTPGNVAKRFIFIRKSSGIRPTEIALPDFSDKDKALDEKKEPLEVDLDKHELPKWLRGLDAHKEHMTILQGLSAKMSENVHWSFSSVMGCFKSNRNTLSAIKRATIDFELAKLFPSPFGHVELSFAGGRTGIVDGYSAPAPQTRNYCYADPDTARSELFKSVLNPDAVNSDNDMLSFLQSREGLETSGVRGNERKRQEKHIQSIEAIRERNEKLIKVSGSLAKHLPELAPVHANDAALGDKAQGQSVKALRICRRSREAKDWQFVRCFPVVVAIMDSETIARREQSFVEFWHRHEPSAVV